MKIKEYPLPKMKKEQILVRWDTKVLLALCACLSLGGGISALIHTVSRFADDPLSLNLRDNWLEWVAALSFLLGWLFAHGIEIAVLQRQAGVTRVLVISLFLVLLIIPWFIPGFISNTLFQFFDFVNGFGFGGFFFRYSMYHTEALQGLPDVLFRKSKGT